MSLININKQDIKDINSYIKSVSPLTIENICNYLQLQGIDKDVFLLRYRDKRTIEDVAECIGISVPTINRTILRLKTMLAIEVVNNNLK